MTEWVSPLSSGTSILSLIKLPSGRRKWQVQQHKGEQTVGVSSQQRAAEAISALPGLIQVTAAPPQSCTRVTGVHLLDPAVPSHHDRAEPARKLFRHEKFWKNLKEKTTHYCSNSKWLLRFQENKGKKKNQEQAHFWTSLPGPFPPNTQTSWEIKGRHCRGTTISAQILAALGKCLSYCSACRTGKVLPRDPSCSYAPRVTWR